METFDIILRYLGIARYIQSVINIFIVTLGMTYLFSNMLEITKTNIGKGRVAIITIIICSITFTVDVVYKFIPKYLFDTAFLIGFGCILYTIIGIRFYSRMDDLQNKLMKRTNEEIKKEAKYAKKR